MSSGKAEDLKMEGLLTLVVGFFPFRYNRTLILGTESLVRPIAKFD